MAERAPYPDIPNQQAFTIGEACRLCGVTANVLRYWEELYPKQLGGVARRAGRRYYQTQDLIMIRTINDLQRQGLKPQAVAKALSNKDQQPDSISASLKSADAIKQEIKSVIKLLS